MITNPDAKRILVFGDSLSWGYMPSTDHERHPANVRWPGRLQDILGDNYEIIEENLNSRAIENEESRPSKEGRRALSYIVPCLDSQDPLDFVIVQLGSNELKHEYDNSPDQIGEQVHRLLQVILDRPSQFRKTRPEVILIAPPIINEDTDYCRTNDKYLGAREKSKQLGKVYEDIARELNIHSLNLADIVQVGSDGCHLDAAAHAKIAENVATLFQKTPI